MPTYVFQDENGVHEELTMSSAELVKRQYTVENSRGQFIDHDGRKLKRVYVPVGTPAASVWPIRSCAAGVGVDQVKEQTEYDRSVGIPTEYCPMTGDAIYTSAGHKRKHLKHHNLVDKDSFI